MLLPARLFAATAWIFISVSGSLKIVVDSVIERSQIRFKTNNSVTFNKHLFATMIAGLAVIDCDNDGLLDVYFVNGAQLLGMKKPRPECSNRRYYNYGDGRFSCEQLSGPLSILHPHLELILP